MYAIYHRPDLEKLAREVRDKYGFMELNCDREFSHVFILGGDGTLLEALHRYPCVLNSTIVHMGLGRVNFYRSANSISIEEAIRRVEVGEYNVLEFSTLRCGKQAALNEVAIYSAEVGKLLKFKITVNGGEIVGRGDGVIVSTPHGTSGYVISTFGPVVDYRISAVVISFVAPYTLYLRPFVLDVDRVFIETNREAILVCDGRGGEKSTNFEIVVGENKLKLATFDNFNFLNRVMERFRSI